MLYRMPRCAADEVVNGRDKVICVNKLEMNEIINKVSVELKTRHLRGEEQQMRAYSSRRQISC